MLVIPQHLDLCTESRPQLPVPLDIDKAVGPQRDLPSGVVNSAVDFGVFALAHSYFDVPIIPANVLSWCVAVSGSYVMNSLTTFAHESGRELRAKAYFSFALSQAAGLVANTTTVVVAS